MNRARVATGGTKPARSKSCQARRVDSGYLSPSDAEALGRMILHHDAWDLYRLESRAPESVSE